MSTFSTGPQVCYSSMKNLPITNTLFAFFSEISLECVVFHYCYKNEEKVTGVAVTVMIVMLDDGQIPKNEQ